MKLAFTDFDQPWPEDYLTLNPHRKVPTLVDEAGEVFYQSAAILFHLADRFPDAGLAPVPGTTERGHLYRAIFMMLQPTYHMHFYPERHVTAAACEPTVDAKASEWLSDLWDRIDTMIGPGPIFSARRCRSSTSTWPCWRLGTSRSTRRFGRIPAFGETWRRRSRDPRSRLSMSTTISLVSAVSGSVAR